MKWVGGPLDGCEDSSRAYQQNVWIGPDPAFPKDRCVVYLLMSDGNYHYSGSDTATANRLLEERRS